MWAMCIYRAHLYHAVPIPGNGKTANSLHIVLNKQLPTDQETSIYYCPLSSTTDPNVADALSKGNGFRFSIKASYDNPFKRIVGIDMQWISTFKDDKEILLFNQAIPYFPIHSTKHAEALTDPLYHFAARSRIDKCTLLERLKVPLSDKKWQPFVISSRCHSRLDVHKITAADTLEADDRDPERWFWAVLTPTRYPHECECYFEIIEGASKINKNHLKELGRLHRSMWTSETNDYFFREMQVILDEQQYDAHFFEPFADHKGLTFMFIKSPVRAMYLRVLDQVEHMVYDENTRMFMPYSSNVLSIMELEASYHAYAQTDGLLNNCYMRCFSQDSGNGHDYYVRYTKREDGAILMDQMRADTKQAVSIVRQNAKKQPQRDEEVILYYGRSFHQ